MTVADFYRLRDRRALVAGDRETFVAAYVAEQRAKVAAAMASITSVEIGPARIAEFFAWFDGEGFAPHAETARQIFAAMFSLQGMQLRDGIVVTRHRSYSGMPYDVRIRVARGSRS